MKGRIKYNLNKFLNLTRNYLKLSFNRIGVINRILEKTNGKVYLEIGICNGETFKLINAKHKIGVDPIPAAEKVMIFLQKLLRKYLKKIKSMLF